MDNGLSAEANQPSGAGGELGGPEADPLLVAVGHAVGGGQYTGAGDEGSSATGRPQSHS